MVKQEQVPFKLFPPQGYNMLISFKCRCTSMKVKLTLKGVLNWRNYTRIPNFTYLCVIRQTYFFQKWVLKYFCMLKILKVGYNA